MSCGSLCCREVDLADADESISTVAHRMRDRAVGSLLVNDEAGRPIGILTDRDIVIRVLACGRDPETTTVQEAMTQDPRTVHEDMPIHWALSRMRAWAIRRLPIIDNAGVLVGILSLDDILDLLSEELALIGQLVATQVHGRSDLPWELPSSGQYPESSKTARSVATTAVDLEPTYFRSDMAEEEDEGESEPEAGGEAEAEILEEVQQLADYDPPPDGEPTYFRNDLVAPLPELEPQGEELDILRDT